MAYQHDNADEKIVATTIEEIPQLRLLKGVTKVRLAYVSGNSGKTIKPFGTFSDVTTRGVTIADAIFDSYTCGPADQFLYLEMITHDEMKNIGVSIIGLYDKMLREQQ